ncbi:MAG: hemolysin family protein [Treponemataceae bacterium]|nr:hemolysin family protein [Treponemataceae bacterium]
MIISIFLLCICIIFSAVFSSSETSFMSISAIKVRQMVKNRTKNAGLVQKLKSNKDRLLTTILIGNNLVNNFASALGASIAIGFCGNYGIGIATVIMTVIILIFGEIVPKTVAANQPEIFATKLAKIVFFFEIVLSPVALIFSAFIKIFTFFIKRFFPATSPLVTEEELKTLIDVGNQEGTLETSEKEMMNKIFEFTDLHVRSIMVNRLLVKGINIDASYKETVALLKETGFSRLPVFDGSFDSICGYIHYRDVLYAKEKNRKFNIKDIMRPVCFVPETKSAAEMMHTFIKEKQNFAVAVDENGCNDGIITMDDILAAVFGRLADEYDKKAVPIEERIEFISSNELRLPGDMLLSDFNDFFKMHLESEYYQTLGGWMLEKFGVLPSPGELLRTDFCTFIVEQQYQRCIKTVRVKFSN